MKKSSKKNLAIVFGITNDYAFALANVLMGIKKHHGKQIWDDIIVYHDNLPKKDQELLNSILRCKFVTFDKSRVIAENLNPVTLKTYSVATLARFYCFDLLKVYKKVIWHDVDILIQKDFSGLLEYGEKSGFALTQTDSNFFVENNFFKPIQGYTMYSVLYNAGIMVVSDKLKKYEKLTNWCFDKLNEIAPDIRWLDQGPLNLMIEEFDIDVEKIDILKYCCHPDRPSFKDAAIIHAYGSNKFWNSPKLREQFPEWVENNNAWVALSKNDSVKKTDLVSIIMSTYERYDNLSESILSLLNQTYQNIEVIVVVEFSPFQKDINHLLNSFKSNKIKIINNKTKLGFAESLNVGIKNAKGVYIARLDDDDVSELNRIERQVEYMNNNPNIGVCGSYVQCFGRYSDKWDMVPTDPEECKTHLLFSTALYHPTVMMRADLINKYKLYYDKNYFTEDYELWSRVIKYTKIANIPEYLVRYRTSDNNITTTSSAKVHESHIAVMKKQFKDYLNLDLTYDELQSINRRIDMSEVVYNRDALLKIRANVYARIIKSNNRINFYDKKSLKNCLSQKPAKQAKLLIKRMAKKGLGPFIVRLDRFVRFRQVDLDSRVRKIESDIARLEIK